MEKVNCFSYGDYSNKNQGVNTLCFIENNEKFYFSYETLVAFTFKGKLYVHINNWGTTTGKHLNWIDGGDKKSRLNATEFENKYIECFGEGDVKKCQIIGEKL